MTERTETAEHPPHPRTPAEQMRRIIDGDPAGADPGVLFGIAASLLRDLDAATATRWTDPDSGETYDLSVPQRDADGAYWRHAGWLGLPGGPRVPLMLWSATRDLPEGGIRRISDLAVLRAVIDDYGPLTAGRDTEPEAPTATTGVPR